MSQEIRAFIVDSFTDQPFKGNPAGVCLSEESMTSNRMQLIAQEFNLSETAFLVKAAKQGHFSIRYFSPKMEILLCGHATLASAKILFDRFAHTNVEFTTAQDLQLHGKEHCGRIEMEFPVYDLQPATANDALLAALGIESIQYCGYNEETRILMLEIASADTLRQLRPDFLALQNSHDSINGVLITAQSTDEFDFHSRYFWPWSGGDEDPVTGGTHTFLAKYWSKKVGKMNLRSFQSSNRTGHMHLKLVASDKLLIRGQAVIVLEGVLTV